MDPILVAVLKALGVGGPMGLLLGYTVKVLWGKLQAKDSCKDPSGEDPKLPPCLRCLACKDRQLATERTDAAKILADERDAAAGVLASERSRFEEKVDELHNEVRDLLREMARAIQGHRPPEDS